MGDCPRAPKGPQPLGTLSAPGEPAAKLSLSRGSVEGQELQGFGDAPAKQYWWGGGLLGAPRPSTPNRSASGAGRVLVWGAPWVTHTLPWLGGEGASHSSEGLWEV